MARNRDNRPELDYDLLVERHERFRSRHPQKKSEKPSDSASPKVKPDLDKAQSSAKAQPVQPSAPEADEAQNAPEAADVAAPVDAPIPDDLDGAVAEAPAPEAVDGYDDDYDLYDEDEQDVEEEDVEEEDGEPANPNPFGSILSFLSRSRDAIGARLKRRGANEDYEEYDPDEDEEDEDDYGVDDENDTSEAAPAADTQDVQPAPDAPAADVSNPSEDAADIFDVPEDDAPAAAPVPQFRDDDDDGEDEDYLDEEDDEDLADDDEEDEPSEGALTRFLHLFVDRADEEDDEEDEEDEDDAADGDAFESDVDESVGVFAPVERRPLGGEIDMQEPRKIDTEMTELMAEGLGERTLSRRERRELQQRREAEREAIAPASGHDEDMEDGVDEPTREFMPISRERATTSSREIEPPASLFDDDEDEEEIEPPISRRAQRLQRKEARLDEEYEDEDDYDDEDEDEPAPKKRSARTSRRHAYDEDVYKRQCPATSISRARWLGRWPWLRAQSSPWARFPA